MLILNPLEPWPVGLTLPACEKHGVKVMTRVVDHGGVFHGDLGLPGHEFKPGDHRTFRPEGWVEHGMEKAERMRPVAEKYGLTLLQFASIWNLSHPAVASVVPTFIQEAGEGARPIEDKIREFAALPRRAPHSRRSRSRPPNRRQHRLHDAQRRQQTPPHQRTPRRMADAIALLDEGATVPFISRYRKEATGGLDDTQLRLLEDRLRYLRELEERREAIIASITEQGKMTPELLKAVSLATDKTHLEDLYLPYKPKRRTKAQIALEAGLEPLADALLANPTLNPEEEAAKYLRDPFTSEAGDANPGVADAKAALDGARQILMERFAEDAGLLQSLREYVQEHGVVQSKVLEGKNDAAEKYADYFDYSESINTIPSHRALAVFRGRREEMLDVQLRLDSEEEKPTWASPHNPCEMRIASRFDIKDMNRPADRWLMDTARWTWRVKSFMHLESELMGALRSKAETEAINVFARNLKALLLAAPAGPRVTMGLDPGIRTGVKVAVVDETGKVVDTATIYPHQPRNDWDGSLHTLSLLAKKHRVTLIAIGNGTASRETDKLAHELIKLCGTGAPTSVPSGRHSGEGRNPAIKTGCEAGKTKMLSHLRGDLLINWIPAFAGMTASFPMNNPV